MFSETYQQFGLFTVARRVYSNVQTKFYTRTTFMNVMF